MQDSAIRTTFCSLVLFFHFFLCPLALLTCWVAWHAELYLIFGFVAGIPAFFTFIWAAVLLGFNNKPGSSHPLTRAKVHLISYYVFAGFYFVTAVLLTSQIQWQCMAAIIVVPDRGECLNLSAGDSLPGCQVAIATIVSNWMVCIFSIASAVFIHTRVMLSGMDANVADMMSPEDTSFDSRERKTLMT